ncbi:MAG: hypothetical protein GY729_16525 [Desulfobacteraceae bacterium]|nr:hypothetical protein [Desulfobacteraceae bacterium]
MVIQKADEKSKKKLLKVIIPDDVVEDYLKAKQLAKKKGLVFDIRPEINKAIKKAVDEALKELGS